MADLRNQVRRWTLPLLTMVLMIPSGRTGRLAAQQPADSSTRSSPQIASTSAPSNSGDYVISVDDVVDVSVFDVPEMSRTYRVRSGGALVLPLLRGPVSAAGLTSDQLAATIGDRLRTEGLISDPRVTVELKESRMRSVVVSGEVRKPQIYPVLGETRLLDVLAQAEGLSENAGTVALVTRGDAALRAPADRTSGQADATTVIDLKRLMETNDPKLNIVIEPGDRVTVERAGIVYVVGAVNRPGGFVMNAAHEPMTVLKAVALAEDLKPTAIGNRALIIHARAAGTTEPDQAPVRLKDMLAGRAADQPLRADEILFVPDSNSQRALRRAAEAAVQAATGVIIWRLP